tara:strand:- start:154 stop:771 length:618 start_codon:yes stop_codon:yes gene_type:complete
MKVSMILFVEFDDIIKNDNELMEKYNERIDKHNQMMQTNYPDSGFDLLTPKQILENISFKPNETKLIPFGLKCAAYHIFDGLQGPCYELRTSQGRFANLPSYEDVVKNMMHNGCVSPQPFCVYPRSSIWKSHFRLANNVGIIDSGYRGTLYGPMHNVKNETNTLVYGNRYLQITMPNLQPFYISVVDKIKVDSQRGVGGIGSTGN